MRIVLADLVHDYVDSNDFWSIPLNIANLAAYVNKYYKDRVEIKLIKFPGEFLKTVDVEIEDIDIIGFSNYLWNTRLNIWLSNYIRSISPKTLIIMGGPNITLQDDKIAAFFSQSGIDFYVPFQGEMPFKSIVESMLGGRRDVNAIVNDEISHGIYYMSEDRPQFKPYRDNIVDLDVIPSPFRNGMLDNFIKADMIPMIETNRGCPFNCSFCDWGASNFRKVTRYSLQRVKEDIRYISEIANDERLLIADANFGLLKERDLEIASFIKKLNAEKGYPGKVSITWTKSKSDIVFEIADELKDLTMLTASFQSMDQQVLKNIKRSNISSKLFQELIDFCKKNGVIIYAELIYGLPGETLESMFNAIRYFFEKNVDFINLNQLVLLEGSEIAKPQQREQFGLNTKWRLMENCYGVYKDTPVIEFQELVTSTSTMTEEDILLLRPLSWLIQMGWNLQRHDLLFRFLKSAGINPLDFLITAVKSYQRGNEKIQLLFNEFFEDTRSELYESSEELVRFYARSEKMEKLKKGGFQKMNTHYTSRVSIEFSDDLFDYYEQIAKELLTHTHGENSEHQSFVSTLIHFMRNRYLSSSEIIRIGKGEKLQKNLTFAFDVLKWIEDGTPDEIGAYYLDVEYAFDLTDKQIETIKNYLAKYSGISYEYQLRKLQEPFQGMNHRNLVFRINQL